MSTILHMLCAPDPTEPSTYDIITVEPKSCSTRGLLLPISPIVLDHGECRKSTEWLAGDDVEIEAEGMRGQLRLQAREQSRQTLGLVCLDVELPRQLTIDRFDHLSEVAHQSRQPIWQLLVLIVALWREQPHAMQLVQLALQQRIDVRFVAQGQQLGLVTQELVGQAAIAEMSWCQSEIGDDAIRSRQQMEFEAIERLLLGRVVAVGGPAIPAMLPSRMVKADHRQRQAVEDTERTLVGRQKGEQEAQEVAANGVGGFA